MISCCELCNEQYDSIGSRSFLVYLRDCDDLKNDSSSWSHIYVKTTGILKVESDVSLLQRE